MPAPVAFISDVVSSLTTRNETITRKAKTTVLFFTGVPIVMGARLHVVARDSPEEDSKCQMCNVVTGGECST
jgi:hypothetical protein